MDQKYSYLLNQINALKTTVEEAINTPTTPIQYASNWNYASPITVGITPQEVAQFLEVSENGNYEVEIEVPIVMNSGKNEEVTISIYKKDTPLSTPVELQSDFLGNNTYVTTSSSVYGTSNRNFVIRLKETIPNLVVGNCLNINIFSETNSSCIVGVPTFRVKQYSNDVVRYAIGFGA